MPDEVELSPLEWLRSALIDLEESRRVVACRPEFEAGVRALVAEPCIGGLVEVRPAPNLPDDTAALIFDPNVIEASARQILQRGAQEARDRLREANAAALRQDLRWAARAVAPLPDPRSAVIVTGI